MLQYLSTLYLAVVAQTLVWCLLRRIKSSKEWHRVSHRFDTPPLSILLQGLSTLHVVQIRTAPARGFPELAFVDSLYRRHSKGAKRYLFGTPYRRQ